MTVTSGITRRFSHGIKEIDRQGLLNDQNFKVLIDDCVAYLNRDDNRNKQQAPQVCRALDGQCDFPEDFSSTASKAAGASVEAVSGKLIRTNWLESVVERLKGVANVLPVGDVIDLVVDIINFTRTKFGLIEGADKSFEKLVQLQSLLNKENVTLDNRGTNDPVLFHNMPDEQVAYVPKLKQETARTPADIESAKIERKIDVGQKKHDKAIASIDEKMESVKVRYNRLNKGVLKPDNVKQAKENTKAEYNKLKNDRELLTKNWQVEKRYLNQIITQFKKAKYRSELGCPPTMIKEGGFDKEKVKLIREYLDLYSWQCRQLENKCSIEVKIGEDICKLKVPSLPAVGGGENMDYKAFLNELVNSHATTHNLDEDTKSKLKGLLVLGITQHSRTAMKHVLKSIPQNIHAAKAIIGKALGLSGAWVPEILSIVLPQNPSEKPKIELKGCSMEYKELINFSNNTKKDTSIEEDGPISVNLFTMDFCIEVHEDSILEDLDNLKLSSKSLISCTKVYTEENHLVDFTTEDSFEARQTQLNQIKSKLSAEAQATFKYLFEPKTIGATNINSPLIASTYGSTARMILLGVQAGKILLSKIDADKVAFLLNKESKLLNELIGASEEDRQTKLIAFQSDGDLAAILGSLSRSIQYRKSSTPLIFEGKYAHGSLSCNKSADVSIREALVVFGTEFIMAKDNLYQEVLKASESDDPEIKLQLGLYAYGVFDVNKESWEKHELNFKNASLSDNKLYLNNGLEQLSDNQFKTAFGTITADSAEDLVEQLNNRRVYNNQVLEQAKKTYLQENPDATTVRVKAFLVGKSKELEFDFSFRPSENYIPYGVLKNIIIIQSNNSAGNIGNADINSKIINLNAIDEDGSIPMSVSIGKFKEAIKSNVLTTLQNCGYGESLITHVETMSDGELLAAQLILDTHTEFSKKESGYASRELATKVQPQLTKLYRPTEGSEKKEFKLILSNEEKDLLKYLNGQLDINTSFGKIGYIVHATDEVEFTFMHPVMVFLLNIYNDNKYNYMLSEDEIARDSKGKQLMISMQMDMLAKYTANKAEYEALFKKIYAQHQTLNLWVRDEGFGRNGIGV